MVARIVRLLATLAFVPPAWRLPVFAMLGVAAGMGLAVGNVSRATSYLSDAPEACANCHVMTTQYLTWQRSSHAVVATCNDCHVPHTNIAAAYAFKARDGIYHSGIFTLRLEPQVIAMSSAAIPVVEANCRRCHGPLISETHLTEWQPGDKRCWDCHREVPHGRNRSLSATSRIMAPMLPSPGDIGGSPRIGGRTARPDLEAKP